jgi:hypothetical protein
MLGLPLGVQKKKGTDKRKEDNDHLTKINKLVSEADELFTADKMTELLELLKPYEGEHDVEIQWRLARACYKVAILPSTSKEDKKRLAYEALDHIQRALSLNSDNFATQEWAGIIVGFIGDFEGNKEKIKKAYIMRDHFVVSLLYTLNFTASTHSCLQITLHICLTYWASWNALNLIDTRLFETGAVPLHG